MITTVTLNPMLDKTVHISRLERGTIHRASRMDLVVGGKGVNVSREARMLGADTIATGFFGGPVGDFLEKLLREEGIAHDFIRVNGMTREGITYLEESGTWTAVFEPPHDVTADEADLLVARCSRLLEDSSWIVCSGSSPAPAADEVFAAIIRRARELGVPSVLDSYGEVFREALRAGPTLVQCNRQEAAKSLELAVESEREIRLALDTMLAHGAAYAVLTDGAGPVYASIGEVAWKIFPPRVVTVNPTGSGDTMVAATLTRFLEDAPFEEALQFGVAAGAANAARWDVASVPESAIAHLLQKVVLQRL